MDNICARQKLGQQSAHSFFFADTFRAIINPPKKTLNVFSHVPSFQLSARTSTFSVHLILNFMEQLFDNHPKYILSLILCRLIFIDVFRRGSPCISCSKSDESVNLWQGWGCLYNIRELLGLFSFSVPLKEKHTETTTSLFLTTH